MKEKKMANFVLLLDTSALYFVLSQRCEARWVSPLGHSSSSMQNNAHDVCANTCTSHAERWRKGETIADSVLPAHPPSAKRHCFPSSFCSPLFFLVDEFSFQHGMGIIQTVTTSLIRIVVNHHAHIQIHPGLHRIS